MRNTEKYAGKRVLVVGMARSGIAAAQLLCRIGHNKGTFSGIAQR